MSRKAPAPAPPRPDFAALGLVEPLQRAIVPLRWETPTPVQREAIPLLLAGRDVLACAQTGTGKTGAFGLALLQRVDGIPGEPAPFSPRAIVLEPTRELVAQTAAVLRELGRQMRGLRVAAVFGGESKADQANQLKHGADILVATPGRLLDLQVNAGYKPSDVQVCILDEADRMFEMGFVPDVRRLLAALPMENRQTAFFSATLPGEILRLAQDRMHNPARVEPTRRSSAAELVTQRVCFVRPEDKWPLLERLLRDHAHVKSLVFVTAQREADRLRSRLVKDGFNALVLHGGHSQSARQMVLGTFMEGGVPIMVATDVAARGLDIRGVKLVVNLELPSEPEGFVHRIGRTGRAGVTGTAIALVSPDERKRFHAIQRLTRVDLQPMTDHPWHRPEIMDEVMHPPGQWRAPSLHLPRGPRVQIVPRHLRLSRPRGRPAEQGPIGPI